MPVIGGPNIVNDDLVFYFDTDNIKSYPGEPTNNYYFTDPFVEWIDGGADGSIVISDAPNYAYIFRTYSTPSDRVGFRSFITDSSLITDVSGGSLIVSFDYRVLSADSSATVRLGYHDCTKVDGLGADYARGNLTFDADSVSLNTWYTYDASWSPTADYTEIRPHFWIVDGEAEVEIRNMQLEKKSHKTSYTPSYRLAVTGLIDLIDNDYVDLTNAFYDPSTDIYYDGASWITQPEIEYDSSTSWTFAQWQWFPEGAQETWNAFCGTAQGTQGYWMHHGTSELTFYQDYYDDGGGYDYYGCMSNLGTNFSQFILGDTLPYNTWFYLTVSYNGISKEATCTLNDNQIVQTHPVTWSPRIDTFKFKYIGNSGSRFFHGYIGTMQIWNRQLLPTEIYKNYYELKSRFGL